ncbi:cell division ATP-binding protein FtsE [Geomicrobium sp. JCM 19038]|uniref:cell division ATP-binding protein FtsE n=1 Tax=Geomicrobium sp. JCM 19038 TaxID=1460635 RepID=UPI00045F4455|nr:cell division ATP-binding protein FtsE [Geomicrobium sp. JCM 19038]GAK07238.1 cell division transporter, ATP-binding protein FtsE [Geomicrobium sp. JCM 19038]
MITMKRVRKTYPNGVQALNGMNIHIDKGEFVYVVGPSGAGKTTFIKLMIRELKPSEGLIQINGNNLGDLSDKQIPYLRRKIGVVFQDFKLFTKLSVYENIAFALEVIEEDPEQIKTKVMDVLEIVGLKSKARFNTSELSGGEKQRIAIARAIVNQPAILIADEPTGNLDPETAWSIMGTLEEINNRGTTIVMATHNSHIVNTLKKRVIAIENGKVVRDEVGGSYGYQA